MKEKKQFFCRFETRRTAYAPIGEPVHCAKDVVEFLRKAVYNDPEEMWREKSVALYLDKQRRIIGYEVLSVGGSNHCTFEPTAMYRTAVEHMAYGVVFVHNHPSNNPQPSREDIEAAGKISKALALLDINLVDVIIFTEKEAFSFTDEKIIKK